MAEYMARLVRKDAEGEPRLILASSCPNEDALESVYASLLSHGPERLVPGDVLIIDALGEGVSADEAVSQVVAMATLWEEVDDEEDAGEPLAERECR